MSIERCSCGNQIDTDADVESFMPWISEHRCPACRFRSLDDAPKDGTVVWLRNQCMYGDEPILGHWQKRPPWCHELHGMGCEPAWVSRFTEWDHKECQWFDAGRLVCPTEWMPQ